MALRIALVLGVTSLALYGSVHADYADRADVQEYIAELVSEHGFTEEELVSLFHEAERKDRILESIARPAERTLEWHEYRRIFLKEPRISQGLEFWAANEDPFWRRLRLNTAWRRRWSSRSLEWKPAMAGLRVVTGCWMH